MSTLNRDSTTYRKSTKIKIAQNNKVHKITRVQNRKSAKSSWLPYVLVHFCQRRRLEILQLENKRDICRKYYLDKIWELRTVEELYEIYHFESGGQPYYFGPHLSIRYTLTCWKKSTELPKLWSGAILPMPENILSFCQEVVPVTW